MHGFHAESGQSGPFGAKNTASLPIHANVRLLLLLLCGILTPFSMRGQSPAIMISTSGIPTDIRIAGPGYFIVRDPAQGTVEVTRNGDFCCDASGYLVTLTGMRVQGFSDPELTQIGDVCISSSLTTAYVANFVIRGDGTILTTFSDGSELVESQILLQNFLRPENLTPFLYGTSFFTASAQPLPQPAPPGSQSLGTLVTSQLEIPTPLLSLSPIHPASPNAAPGILTVTDIPTDLAIN